MATFPLLKPSAAPITPGAWPASTIGSLNGAESRVRQGSAEIGRRLRLTFTNITEADFLAILSHYRGQRSGFDAFGFDTVTLAADLTPAGFAWLYASRPQAVDEHLDVFTVQCEFRAEPRGLVVAMGAAWRSAQTSLTRNVAPGKAFLTSSTTFLPGTGARFAAGVRWVTEATRFTRDSVGRAAAWVTSATTLIANTPRGVVIGSSSGGSGAALTFTGGTEVPFDINEGFYGFVFTLTTAKTVAGFGIYNPTQSTLTNGYVFSVYQVDTLSPFYTSGYQLNQAASIIPGDDQYGNPAFYDGWWRRVNLSNQFTLQPGTYALFCQNDENGLSDTIVKNATGVSAASGVTFVKNIAYYTGGDDATISADGIAYFGPMIFFT
jgi:hypothetical protein